MGVALAALRPAKKQETHILMLGLEGSGKMTILRTMGLEAVMKTHHPTIGMKVITVEQKGFKLAAWDVGLQDRIRSLYVSPWDQYYCGVNTAVFVMDSTNHDRIEDASDELRKMLGNEELRDAVVLVLVNKQDLPGAMTVQEVSEKLGLEQLKTRPWLAQPCCAVTGAGLDEGFAWVSRQLAAAGAPPGGRA